MEAGYVPPNWAGKPDSGYHLEVSKDGKMFQNLPIDKKPYYTFGRNMSVTDFCIDHQSCSRVHAALVYHKHLKRFFLTDLGSTHGSHIGNVRLEPNKLTALHVDSTFHFGASTRMYTLRESPKQSKSDAASEEDVNANLPETEYEIDHLTLKNTLKNRSIATIGIATESGEIIKPATAMKRKFVTFNEDEDIINPEDVDPTVGRFRNLVQSTIVIPNSQASKRPRLSDSSGLSESSLSFLPRINPAPQMPPPASTSTPAPVSSYSTQFLTAKSLGIHLPSPAPEPDEPLPEPTPEVSTDSTGLSLYDELMQPVEDTSPKKKYAKEAWPGHHSSGTPLANF